ncbi:hypothetical protein FQZ97_1109470 [compost metagenome]
MTVPSAKSTAAARANSAPGNLAGENSGPPIRKAMPVRLRPSATRLRRVGRAPSRGQASIIAQIGIE